jgi:putative lipoprotein
MRAVTRLGSVSLAAALGALAIACASPAPRKQATLAGTITARERIALPSEARVEIQLLDATKGDDAESLVAERLLESPGQMPIPFTLPYDPRSIDANRTYTLRVRVRVADDLWFASPFDLRVLTAGNPSQVEVLLDRVSAGGAPVSAGRGAIPPDPDPAHLDPRVRAVRTEAGAIDARLDRLDMREIPSGGERLQLWVEGDEPVKLQVLDAARAARAAAYYFRDGQLFWARVPSAGYVFENGALVLRTDGKLAPVADPTGAAAGNGVLRDLQSRLALFGL